MNFECLRNLKPAREMPTTVVLPDAKEGALTPGQYSYVRIGGVSWDLPEGFASSLKSKFRRLALPPQFTRHRSRYVDQPQPPVRIRAAW